MTMYNNALRYAGAICLMIMASTEMAEAQVYVDQIQPNSRSGARTPAHSYAPAPSFNAAPLGPASLANTVFGTQGGAVDGVTQRATVQQNGTGNRANVSTTGDGNVTSQVQNGRDNVSNLSATGTQNSLATVQNG